MNETISTYQTWLTHEWGHTVLFVQADPAYAIVIMLASLSLTAAVFMWIKLKLMRRRERLRGSRMTKKQREKWRRKRVADLVINALEAAHDRGELTDAEVSLSIRQLSGELRNPDLKTQKRMGTVQVVKPTKSGWTTTQPKEGHLKTVKAGIINRLSFRVRKFLNRPVTIPGPGPIAEVKPTTYVTKRKSKFFGDKVEAVTA